MTRRVAITGLGTITPLGHDVETLWRALLDVRSGISTTELFDASTFPTTFSAQVKGFDLADHLPNAADHAHAGRATRFALAAARQAWLQAGLDRGGVEPARLGLYLGCGEGSLDFDSFAGCLIDAWRDGRLDTVRWAELAHQRMDRHRELEQEANMVAAHLAAQFDVRGATFNVLTACAASTQALGEATWLIRRGDADAVISGGSHSMIHPLGLTGFNRLTALSTRNDALETASRPFDMTRDGFVLGEGSSILILEDLDTARRRGATILAEVIGVGSSADAFRITDQDPAGDGAAAAMRLALDDAGLAPGQIDYISTHGTGTQQNDTVETKAMKAAFGEAIRSIPCSSVKSMVGHLIAAAGATELITCVLAIRDGVLPPTAHLATPDPECDLDYVPNAPRRRNVDIAMSNSMGFGGQNDSIIIRRYAP
ncbi:MAG: beta-ketoacyl-[acyl-carrier-protein] synthase family protein [Planctomycetes bacterium]|nr:beta-ketoacyl-[acyl-carrier-protein] synthase family protein [Planctomycetota bacterium]